MNYLRKSISAFSLHCQHKQLLSGHYGGTE